MYRPSPERADDRTPLASLSRFFRRDAIADVDDELRFHFDKRVEQYRASGMSNEEAVEAAHAQFGVATVGVYSSVSYSVSQRTHEFGVRIALGAAITDVLGPVIRRALSPVVVGVAIGLASALASGKLIASLLYGIEPWDVGVLIVVALVLIGAATLAALLPAGRAARVDPVIALRPE
jgi:ABC-type lipoprotein release transport system permease subunit